MSEDDKAYKISAELQVSMARTSTCRCPATCSSSKARSAGEEEKDKNYYFSERAYGSFQRAFELPASVDRDKVAADFSKGVLTITLPKAAEAQKPQKKIEVKSA